MAVKTFGSYPNAINSDGANPYAELILSGGILFGVAQQGGSSGGGTVFAIRSNGTSFTNLYSFSMGQTNLSSVYTNRDGANPVGGLVLSGSKLYGTALLGGDSGGGTVFAINTDGTGFTKLYSFTAAQTNSSGFGLYTNNDGYHPYGGLILSSDTLYGTTDIGGLGGGTVFSLSFAPQLTISLSGTNIILTWPTNYVGFDYTGFTLQSTTNLFSPPVVWSTNLPAPVVVNGQNTVTNPLAATQQFYRLIQ